MNDRDGTRASGSPGRAALAALDVLVVEDDADTRDMLAALLEQDGLRVRCAASVAEALAAVREAPPDVIVSDLALGAEHGHDLAARLRDDPDTHDLAIVAITGSVDPEWDVVRHFDAYLVKPLDHRAFPAFLRTLATSIEAARARTSRR